MKTHSPLIILLLWLIALVISSVILYSCSKTHAEQNAVHHDTTFIMKSGYI